MNTAIPIAINPYGGSLIHQQGIPRNHAPTIFPMNEFGCRQYLSSHNWPTGLQDTLVKSLARIPVRFFICDDSGSMTTNDGKKVRETNPCSRWAELAEALRFHVGLANAACTYSEFRLLNGAPPIPVGLNESSADNAATLCAIFESSPSGGTPLCRHIYEVTNEIRILEPHLRAAGQKVSLIILTDGVPSDGNLIEAMLPLKMLPVWVVIRLCTDDEKIVKYWNDIDKELELDMDVIDDFSGEAKEVERFNRWLTYAEPLQRLREFGISTKELDLVDERSLSADEMVTLLAMLFGGAKTSFPNPEDNFQQLLEVIEMYQSRLPDVWCPIALKMRPWIDAKALSRFYHRRDICHACTIM